MATFKVLLDTRRELQDGTYPLVVRIYNGRGYKTINPKIYLKENQFDYSKQKVKRNHPNEKLINMRIKQIVLQAESTKLNMELRDEVVSAEKIKSNILRPQPKLNFIQYGEKIATEMRSLKRLGNALAYEGALNALKKYSGKSNLQFSDVNYELLKSMEGKMVMEGLKKNSIAAYNRSLRAIFNRAINENLVESKLYPYRKYKIRGEQTAKRNISRDEMRAIASLPLEPESPLWHSRNFFLLSFNLRGISFADMASIKVSDIASGRLVYKRKKTHKLYFIKLTDKAKEILSYYQQPSRTYVLPVIAEDIATNPDKQRKTIIQAIKTCNKYLKRIGQTVGIQKLLTTYVARFSWANIAKSLGYSKDLIAEALGHELGNPVTGIYLDSFDQEVIDEMNERVCDLSK
jgi:integrase/recombinase XerD